MFLNIEITIINPRTADKVNPIAPSMGIPFIFGGMSAITKSEDPIDKAAIMIANTKRFEALFNEF